MPNETPTANARVVAFDVISFVAFAMAIALASAVALVAAVLLLA
ncbi:MAG: hypothetical protein WD886_05010 [Burkholderiales bacterium]